MLQLYFSPGACSLVTHIALEEAGAKFEFKPISLRKGHQRAPDYLKLNPKGKVPLLIVDGQPLTENVAILTYIARTHPAARLLPSGDLTKEIRALELLAWLASGVHPVFGRIFGPQRFCDVPGTEDNLRKLALAATAQNFELIERQLAGKDWALGDFSVADGYIFVFYRWAKAAKLDLTPFPNYTAHQERMLKRPGVQRALAREQDAQAELDKAA